MAHPIDLDHMKATHSAKATFGGCPATRDPRSSVVKYRQPRCPLIVRPRLLPWPPSIAASEPGHWHACHRGSLDLLKEQNQGRTRMLKAETASHSWREALQLPL